MSEKKFSIGDRVQLRGGGRPGTITETFSDGGFRFVMDDNGLPALNIRWRLSKKQVAALRKAAMQVALEANVDIFGRTGASLVEWELLERRIERLPGDWGFPCRYYITELGRAALADIDSTSTKAEGK